MSKLGNNGALADIDADVLADIVNFPIGGDPWLQLENDEQRKGALRTLHWIVPNIGNPTLVKIAAFRYVFRIEPRPMEIVAEKLGVTRSAISKETTSLADSLGIASLRSKTRRLHCQRAALKGWERRRKKLTNKARFYSGLARFHFAVLASASSEIAGVGFSQRGRKERI